MPDPHPDPHPAPHPAPHLAPPLPAGIALRALSGDALTIALPDLARLRVSVFRDWPYLYDGDAAYEERYLATFASAPGAVVIGAFDGQAMVGAATACPLAHADPAFAAPFEAAGRAPADWFYFGESVLEPAYRGRGIGVGFFTHREAAAARQGFARTCFCAVERLPDDPRRPPDYVPLDAFWRRRGYAPLDLWTRYEWRDVGEDGESAKPMRFWGRDQGRRRRSPSC